MCLQLVQLRREVAGLLRANKQDNARIRVEAVIQEQKMLRAYDIIEVFVELLAVRVELIAKSKDIPPDMLEAVSSVVYAAQRIQVGLLGTKNTSGQFCAATCRHGAGALDNAGLHQISSAAVWRGSR